MADLFQSLDDTLNAVLTEGGFQLDFRIPDAGYDGTLPAGNINLHLYQTYENRELRSPAPIVRKRGNVFVREQPPLRVDCTYLVTAWKNGAAANVRNQEEHELLGKALRWLSRFPNILARHLRGDLQSSGFQIPTEVAQMNGVPNIGEFWSALGKAPRPSFNLVVTVPMDLGLSQPEGFPVATKSFEDGIKTVDAAGENDLLAGTEQKIHWQIGGNVVAQPHPNPNEVNAGGFLIPGVLVRLVKAGAVETDDDKFATTNDKGRFSFTVRQPGDYTLKVEQISNFKPIAPKLITVPSIPLPPANPAAPAAEPYDIIDLELEDAFKSVTGRVIEVGTGVPMNGVDVFLDKSNFVPPPIAEITDTTDANGDFTLAAVNFAGRYKLRFESAAIDKTFRDIVVPSDKYVLELNKK